MPFDGRLLSGVTVLAAVVESGSFARAADAIGITTSGVSRAVARLEARIGARLLDRTTRSIALTDEGRRFYEKVKTEPCHDRGRREHRLGRDELGSRAAEGGHRPRCLKSHSSRTARPIPRAVSGIVARVHDREQIGDLVGDGIDVAVRFGEPAASSLIRRKLAALQVITVATPGYLKRHGRPKHPNDLAHHACIHLRDPLTRQPYVWEFHKDGKCSR